MFLLLAHEGTLSWALIALCGQVLVLLSVQADEASWGQGSHLQLNAQELTAPVNYVKPIVQNERDG